MNIRYSSNSWNGDMTG